MCLALVVLRVQGLVLDAALVQQARQLLGALDGHGADEAGLARLVALGHVVGHGVELRLHRAVDEVVLVLSGDWAVRRDGHDRQLVDLAELGVLGHGRAGHAGELLVQAEVVLQRDGGQRLVLLAHEHALFRLERLVQALGVAAAFHDAAGELVDDLHLAVHHDVVHVAVEQELGLERLLQVVRQLAGRVGVDVVDAEHGLDLLQAALGGVDGLLRLVHVEVGLGHEADHDARELIVRLGRLRARSRDDERRAGFVDEDGVHLVDDGEVVAALHAGLCARHHVVAQVVEAELAVRAVSDIRLVGGYLLVGAHAVLDEAHLHAEEAVHLPHPLAVATGQVVVDGDHVHVVAGQGVQVAGQRGDERLALAGLHLGDLAVVQSHAADELHVEVTQPQRAHRGLAHGGERFGQKALEILSVLGAFAERGGERAKLLVRARLHLGFEAVDLGRGGFVVLELLALAKRQELGKKSCHVCAILFVACSAAMRACSLEYSTCYSSISRLTSKEIHRARKARREAQRRIGNASAADPPRMPQPAGSSAAARLLVETFGEPHLDHGLPPDAHALRFLVERLHHPDGHVDVDALRLGSPLDHHRGIEIEEPGHVAAFVEQLFEILRGYLFVAHSESSLVPSLALPR